MEIGERMRGEELEKEEVIYPLHQVGEGVGRWGLEMYLNIGSG